MTNYVVIAPLVIAKNEQGADVYLYQGAALPSYVKDADRERFLRDELVASEEDAAKRDAQNRLGQTGQVSAATPDGSGGGSTDSGGGEDPPAKSASKGDWVDYAVAQGADRGEAEAATKDELVEKYGS